MKSKKLKDLQERKAKSKKLRTQTRENKRTQVHYSLEEAVKALEKRVLALEFKGHQLD